MKRLTCIIVHFILIFLFNRISLSQDATIYEFPDGWVPVIDGISDAIWDYVEVHNINRNFREEVPTLDMATWQAAWNDTAIFILITVEEDDFYPDWESGDFDWNSDKVEIYLDVNEVLDDGQGPVTANTGHYQFAPDFVEGFDQYVWDYYNHAHQDAYAIYGYTVNNNDYIYEYSIRIADLIDKDVSPLNPYTIDEIGFDVTITDRDYGDNGRRRAVWKNTGETDEAWNNMDDCGILTFSTDEVEAPESIIKKLPDGLAPEIDGSTDGLWAYVKTHNIGKSFQLEEPTIDLATWQAVWNDTAIFLIVTVEEDDFCPSWCEPAQIEWMSDKIEVYLDVNGNLEDGQGPNSGPNGHYQFAPVFIEGEDTYSFSGETWQGYYHYSYKVNNPNYIFEYAIPFSTLEDKNLDELLPTDGKQIGFDVYVIDRDEGESIRKRTVWMNDGKGPTSDEAWNNMDDCGILIFSTDELDVEAASVTPTILADKYAICKGEKLQLQAICNECIDATLSYSWNSVPSGFSSDVPNPEVLPDLTTLYTLNISNRFNYGSASLYITVKPVPDKPEIRLKGENILICIDSGLYSYQWYYNDEIISGETKQFCQVNTGFTGDFFIETGYENQCKTKSDPFNFSSKSGTLKSDEPIIEIYPVPNSGNFTLKIAGDESGRAIINVRDFSGAVIKSIIIDKFTEPLSEEISITNFPKGIYLLDILLNNVTFYRKLVIN